MANNRMYLLHRPSRKAVRLGKRMGWGWYGVPDNAKDMIEALFKDIAESGEFSQDDFCIAMEDCGEAPMAEVSWESGETDERGIVTLPHRP